MEQVCSACKHGHDLKPDGQRPAGGTVWCSLRKIQMARGRQLPCFVPRVVVKTRRCVDCKRAKMVKPSGEAPQLGHVWCEKRHAEVNKQRAMECLE